jgi:hypothetical protein
LDGEFNSPPSPPESKKDSPAIEIDSPAIDGGSLFLQLLGQLAAMGETAAKLKQCLQGASVPGSEELAHFKSLTGKFVIQPKLPIDQSATQIDNQAVANG